MSCRRTPPYVNFRLLLPRRGVIGCYIHDTRRPLLFSGERIDSVFASRGELFSHFTYVGGGWRLS